MLRFNRVLFPSKNKDKETNYRIRAEWVRNSETF